MTPSVHRLGRRMFLTELGRRAFAVTILGGIAVSCSDDDKKQSAAATTTAASGNRLEWERVNLGFVSAYVLVRSREAAVVDTGVAGSEAAIAAALTNVGAGWDAVNHVLVTHLHPDHAGSIGAVLTAAEGAVAHAGAADIGGIPSPRPVVPVGDGDEVFGLEVIATPGHTAGHISILDRQTGVMIMGDALRREGDGVGGSNPQFTADSAQAEASIRKLAGLQYDTALFGHGDPIARAADEAVAAYARTL
jgi:glyoxylase-like metal-dependent hydrolase (beta-lactamase superfamily II)